MNPTSARRFEGLVRSTYRRGLDPSRTAAPSTRNGPSWHQCGPGRAFASSAKNSSYPLITLEEHFISKHIGEPAKLAASIYGQFPPSIKEQLTDFDAQRLHHMDAGSVSLQVISHAPADASPDACAHANDELAEQVSRNPTRYAGFAMLPISHPEAAAVELERCVKDLGFLGALIDNHLTDGTYYDGTKFWPMFEAAERLDVPLYIHPTFQAESRTAEYVGNYNKAAETALGHWGWGWHSNTAQHVLRLFAAGVFDKYPKLKIVIGHMGEMLPFQLERTAIFSKMWGERTKGLKQVWDENIWITTSGMFSVNPMASVLRITKLDHILYSVDYPFATNEDGLKFIEDLKTSGLVSEEEMEMIAYKNAEKLLKVKATALT
ncbi:hypothetical protein MMC12_000285 [Toensbergia leucococca]|nr:hypothetical protein [Toensbergia leucococca]